MGHFFEGKPRQKILQIALDRQRLTNAVLPVFAQLFDLVIVLVEKRMGVTVPDEASDPPRNATVLREAAKPFTYIFRFFG